MWPHHPCQILLFFLYLVVDVEVLEYAQIMMTAKKENINPREKLFPEKVPSDGEDQQYLFGGILEFSGKRIDKR